MPPTPREASEMSNVSRIVYEGTYVADDRPNRPEVEGLEDSTTSIFAVMPGWLHAGYGFSEDPSTT